jgi:hypothetical protein
MAIAYKIERTVPVPTDFRTTDRKYPFEEMEVGDSFFITPEYEDETIKRLSNRMAQARQAYQRRGMKQNTPVQFTQRIWTDEETEETGVRIWRIPLEEKEDN